MEANRLAWAENGVRGGGLSLPAGARALFEAQFGTRFTDVRLHTGPRAADAAQRLGAAAFTLGRDIGFGHGSYSPHTGSGLRLLSHELAHVVQSRDAPANPRRAGAPATALAPLEREAARASGALGRGPMTIRQRLAGRTPLCHPVYISAHGPKGYLDAAADFHRKWGNTPLKTGVPSIEAMLRDLAEKSSIGQVTIVSHANPSFIQMQFIDSGSDEVFKSDWQVVTVAELVKLERHLVAPATIDKLIEYVQRAEPTVLPRIGPVTDPLVRQFIWWVVDQVYAEYAGFPAAQAIRMRTAGQAHAAVYRSRLLAAGTQASGAGSAQPAVTAKDLDEAERAAKTQALRFTWPKPTRAATASEEQRLRESPSADIQRVAEKPVFFQNLTLVRGKISNDSWIEIQGCNAGADRGYLEGVQSFFGGADKKPKVTAPDWFQSFGHYGFTTISEAHAKDRWSDKEVKAALAYWYPIITRKPLPKRPTELTLLEYLRQGHALPLAVPGTPGRARVLLLNTQGRKAFLEWLSRHSYQLTRKEIEQKLFAGTDLGADVEGAVVDMLKEQMGGPTKVIFRPSPEYQKHIIEVH